MASFDCPSKRQTAYVFDLNARDLTPLPTELEHSPYKRFLWSLASKLNTGNRVAGKGDRSR